MLYLGCPQWSSNHWRGRVFTRSCQPRNMLSEYAQVFNSVEGNTSFYADPSSQTILNWKSAVPEHFRFTFKLPQRISHESGLVNCQHDLLGWFKLFEPIHENIGSIMIQLPKSFSPADFNTLEQFVRLLPSDLRFSLEVRHLGFYRKDDIERKLNQLLMAQQIDRIMMDTRALFNEPATTEAIIDAQRKKPRLPVHVIATAHQPIVRFVGCSALEQNALTYKPWLNKIKQWLNDGLSPYIFFHTADNIDAPFLARQFITDLAVEHPVLKPFPSEKEATQSTLF